MGHATRSYGPLKSNSRRCCVYESIPDSVRFESSPGEFRIDQGTLGLVRIRRVAGEPEVLLGMDVAGLEPEGFREMWDGLRVPAGSKQDQAEVVVGVCVVRRNLEDEVQLVFGALSIAQRATASTPGCFGP